MARFRDIESRLQHLDGLHVPDVVLKAVSAQDYLSLRDVLPGMDAVRRRVENIVAVVPSRVGKSILSTIAIVIHSPVYDPEALDVEVGYLFTGNVPDRVILSEDRILTPRKLPAVDLMATIVHVGPVSSSHTSYGLLAQWLEANQYQIAGTMREILMQLPLREKGDEAVIELQLPVSKQDFSVHFI